MRISIVSLILLSTVSLAEAGGFASADLKKARGAFNDAKADAEKKVCVFAMALCDSNSIHRTNV